MKTPSFPAKERGIFQKDRRSPFYSLAKVMMLGWAVMATLGAAWAQEVEILSLSRNGLITWTNSSLNVTCHVEWASSLEGPWHRSWTSLRDIFATNHVTARKVPMLYRVVCMPPPPFLTNVMAAEALDLVISRKSDPDFVIIDVRTPSEYNLRYIRSAINVDYYTPSFEDDLNQMDKTKTYLVYCASGNRAGSAVQIMQGLGFNYIYYMIQGFGTFASLPGAGPYLIPPDPFLTEATAAEALDLVITHKSDSDFVIIDVRTVFEYDEGHIRSAVNVDYYATSFEENVDQLDKTKSYLVYCASGNRASYAVQIMQDLGFDFIYQMTDGFGTFAALPGAGPYLEP